ncbi:MAG: hypothetical protein U9N14_06160 [Pseudomonadota bacterium]|nr:hypothetical protein [Pseudomonadota bacterium]
MLPGSTFEDNEIDIRAALGGRNAHSVLITVLSNQDIRVVFNDVNVYPSRLIQGLSSFRVVKEDDQLEVEKIYFDNSVSGAVNAVIHIWAS